MSTRDIRTSHTDTACDVCGRTLLRGERAEVYLDGAERRSVCELCKSRAIHEGWIREGTVPAYGAALGGSDRRRSLLGRLRRRGEPRTPASAQPTLSDELDNQAWQEAAPEPVEPADDDPAPLRFGSRRARAGGPPARRSSGPREPRHVRAVPSSAEQRAVEAVDVFNSSEYKRTIAGVARSLGVPAVAVLPSAQRPGLVNITVSWELCWYRYEVDLSDDQPSVRVSAQGYELDELEVEERRPNAGSDENGALSVAW